MIIPVGAGLHLIPFNNTIIHRELPSRSGALRAEPLSVTSGARTWISSKRDTTKGTCDTYDGICVCDHLPSSTRREALDELKYKRFCCRRMFISNVDLLGEVLKYVVLERRAGVTDTNNVQLGKSS